MQTHQPITRMGGNSHHESVGQQIRQTVTHPVAAAPISTSLLVFGAGLGLGALIGSMIADASAQPLTRRSQAEALGRSILDSFSSAMPDSVKRHLHS